MESVGAASSLQADTSDPAASRLRRHAWLAAALVAVALINLYFVAQRLHLYVEFSEASYSPYFWPRRSSLFLHIWGGLIALVCGLAQVWLGATGQTGALHRRLGWIYVGSLTVSVVGAIQLSTTVPGHFAYASGLFMNAVVWAITTAIALWALRQRRIDVHREWMLRSYVLALAFTMARMMLPAFRATVEVPHDPIADDIQAATAWACWIVPLFLFEIGRAWVSLRKS